MIHDALTEHLTAVHNGEITRFIATIPPGPMRDDSIVETSRGSKLLRDITTDDHVLTHTGKYRPVTDVHDQGTLPILEIKTFSGRTVHAAPTHPFLTPTGWVEAQRLRVDDNLAVVNPQQPRDECEIAPETARLLGYMVGDGSLRSATPAFTNMDYDSIQDFIECLNFHGFEHTILKRKNRTAWVVNVRGGRPVHEFFASFDLMWKGSYEKHIPDQIKSDGTETLRHFLGAYWSCDGSLNIRKTHSRGSIYRAHATTVSNRLAQDLHYALTQCGIESRIRIRTSNTLKSKRQNTGIYTYYQLEIQKEEHTAHILDLPGLCQRKAQYRDQLRKKFTRVTWEDPIISIEPSEPARCMCLTVDTDHSFTCSGIAVKNSTKSLTTRVFSPVWGWLQNPHSRYIGASYAHHLSTRDNRRAQQLITSDWFRQRFPELKIDPRRQAVENFGNNQTGWMLATSVEGIGTGERGDQFVIDDPLSAKQADSPTYRQAALKWFYETVPSRLNDLDSGQILIIMQRLHEEDVANAAIELGYDHLNIPMHFDTEQIRKPTSIGWTDPRTKHNQLMWPERFSESAVIKLEQSLGPYASAAQLEQTPVPRTGGLIETDLIIMKEQAPASIMDPDNPNIIRVRAWDFAGSKGKGAYTVGALLATDITDPDRSLYILDVRRQRLNPAGVRALVSSTAEDDPPGTVILYPKDPGQSGLDQVQSYATLLEGYSHKAEPQTGSKEERAEPFAAKVGASQVYLLEKGWTDHYKQELRFFPKGKYKDQVDATASAYNEIARRLRHKRTPEVRLVSESQSNRAKVN